MRTALLLKARPSDRLRRIGIQLLCDTFAAVFGVRAPRLRRVSADEALRWFREFSAVCIEAACADTGYAARKRCELQRAAYDLGARVRAVLGPHDAELSDLVAYLYRAIGIGVSGEIPGELVFARCYFSERYTPRVCAFMSAFDSGFVGGLCGGGALEFTQRITEGAGCCRALFAVDGRLRQAATVPGEARSLS